MGCVKPVWGGGASTGYGSCRVVGKLGGWGGGAGVLRCASGSGVRANAVLETCPPLFPDRKL